MAVVYNIWIFVLIKESMKGPVASHVAIRDSSQFCRTKIDFTDTKLYFEELHSFETAVSTIWINVGLSKTYFNAEIAFSFLPKLYCTFAFQIQLKPIETKKTFFQGY